MRPFEIDFDSNRNHLDEMVDATFAELQSQFLVLPRGNNLVEFASFQNAYECLKKHTSSFTAFTEATVWDALREDALCFVVVRSILGFSPPEWADLAKAERLSDIGLNSARTLDVKSRQDKGYFNSLSSNRGDITLKRTEALVSVAVEYIVRGAPEGTIDTVHRMDKVDTSAGIISLQQAANLHVPYSVLLYERFMGRPFASHRDSVSGLVGDVMESAIEERLARAKVSFRQTKRAERIANFDQAPDFFIPTEFSPSVIIEAKITGDDGTARDKVARILRLAHMRDEKLRSGQPGFEIVACIDGRGFGVRRQDMRDLLNATLGKVFTLSTLDHLIPNTQIKNFVPLNAD